MAWWVYKCNENGGYDRANWDYVFNRNSETQWGSTRIRGLRQLQPNDRVIAYQTDRNELVGVVEVVRLVRRGAFDDVLMRRVERIGANLKELKLDHASIAKIPAFQSGFPRTLYAISARDARNLLVAARKQATDDEQQRNTNGRMSSSEAKQLESAKHIFVGSRNGGGFGDPDRNRLAEKKAVDFVTSNYEGRQWTVQSVENQNCGFDLRCKKGRAEENVEVKGVAGDMPAFIITAGEVREAKSNPRFALCIVTRALSKKPRLARLTGAEFLASYRLDPIQFRAVPVS